MYIRLGCWGTISCLGCVSNVSGEVSGKWMDFRVRVQETVWFWFDDRVREGPFLGYFLGCSRLSL